MGVVSSLAGTLAAEELNHPDGSYFAFTTPRSHAGTEGRTVEPCTHRHVPVCIVYSVVHSFTSAHAVDGTTGGPRRPPTATGDPLSFSPGLQGGGRGLTLLAYLNYALLTPKRQLLIAGRKTAHARMGHATKKLPSMLRGTRCTLTALAVAIVFPLHLP